MLVIVLISTSILTQVHVQYWLQKATEL